MRLRGIAIVACALMLACWLPVRADDKPADKSDAGKTDSSSHVDTSKVHLTQPWSKLTDLTPDQVDKIKQIHGKALEDMKEIKAKEKSDIMALLSDDQKKEVGEEGEKASADRKAKSAAKSSKSSKSSSSSDSSGDSKAGTDKN